MSHMYAMRGSYWTVGHKKLSCRQDSRPYWLSVTFNVIQGRWFSFYLKGRMRVPISDQQQPCMALSLTVSEIWPVLHWIFYLPLHLTRNFKMFPLHHMAEILHAWVQDTWLVIGVKSFFSLWANAKSQYIHYRRQTMDDDGRTKTVL